MRSTAIKAVFGPPFVMLKMVLAKFISSENEILELTNDLDRRQLAVHIKHLRDQHSQRGGNLISKQHGRIRLPAFDRNDGLADHTRAQSKLLLRHSLLEAESPDVIAKGDGCHGNWMVAEKIQESNLTSDISPCKMIFKNENTFLAQ